MTFDLFLKVAGRTLDAFLVSPRFETSLTGKGPEVWAHSRMRERLSRQAVFRSVTKNGRIVQ